MRLGHLQILILLGYFLLLQPCVAQENYLVNFRKLETKNGLAGKRILSFCQDHNGFMWVGTEAGLNKFDGYNFERFNKVNHGLYSNYILGIAEDSEGYLWLYSKRPGQRPYIELLHSETYELVSFEEKTNQRLSEFNFRSYTLISKEDKTILFFSRESPIYEYHPDMGLTMVEALRGNQLISYAGNNTFWAQGENAIIKLSQAGKVLETYAFPDNNIRNVLGDGKEIWVQSNTKSLKDKTMQLFQYNEAQGGFEMIINDYSSKDIVKTSNAFFNPKHHTFHFPTSNGIHNTTVPEFRKGFASTHYLDNNGYLWLGLRGDCYIVETKENPFKLYLNDFPERNYNARGIWADENYMYPLVKHLDIRYRINIKTHEYEPIEFGDLPVIRGKRNKSEGAKSVAIPFHDEFWIGGGFHAVAKIDPVEGKAVEILEWNPKDYNAWAIMRDKDGKWWLGDGSRGLVFFDPEEKEAIRIGTQLGIDGLDQNFILHLLEDGDHICIASNRGWFRFNRKTNEALRYWQESEKGWHLPMNEVQYTYIDNEGFYWVATADDGLFRVELDQASGKVISYRQFTQNDGLSSNTICAIFEDKNGFLWLSSSNGIIQFNKTTFEVRAYLREHGLSHHEFNRISAFQSKDGKIYFGGLNGIVAFYPEDLYNTAPYEVELKISGYQKYLDGDTLINLTQDLLTEQAITINPQDRFVYMSVTLQDYLNASDLKYYYKIEGLNDDYQLNKDNVIQFSKLPYGSYTLKIKAQGIDNRYSTKELSLDVEVIPPIFLRPWFIILVIALLALASWLFLRWRTRRLLYRQKELEAMVRERTKELEEDKKTIQALAEKLEEDKSIIENQAEELKSLDEMKTRFFGNISHELRTPLTLILSPLKSILKRNELSNRDFTYVKIIQQNAQSLLKRINEILDLTKLEAGEMQLRLQPTHFYEFTKRLASTFESSIQMNQKQLSFDYQLDKNLQILLDKDKYEHIFNNYLSNALKYTPKGGSIEVKVFEKTITLPSKLNQNRIVLEVKDTGQGIHPDDIPHLFERFYQSRHAENKAGSSGIGLALSREIAQLMKGAVKVESELGQGSSFFFEMPFKEYLGTINSPQEQEEDLIGVRTPLITPDQPQTNAATILLVEDNVQLRQYIELALSTKYNVVTAENGSEGIELLQSIDQSEEDVSKNNLAVGEMTMFPDLILSDIMMPIMDGFEFLEHLKKSDNWRSIPVIMLTARNSSKDKLKALRIGVDDYILKPFEEEELIARIDNMLANLANRQTLAESTPQKKKIASPTEKEPLIITQADEKWLIQVENLLKSEIANPQMNAIELASKLNMSRRQLQRRIKKTTGLTPNKYIRETKLQAAREILESGDVHTVSEVTYAVGFDTPSYFSNLFKERFGKKPIEYLR